MAQDVIYIDELPAVTALTGAELLPVDQVEGLDLVTRKATLQNVADLSINSPLTGFTAEAGTVSETDDILTAFEKIVGNIAAMGAVENVTAATRNLTAADSGKYFTNSGATATVNYVGPSGNVNPVYHILSSDADGCRFSTNGSDTIIFGDSTSSPGGYIACADIGGSLTVVKVNAAQWQVVSAIGTWTVN